MEIQVRNRCPERALLDVALTGGWQPGERRVVEVDGWCLLEPAAAARAGNTGPEDPSACARDAGGTPGATAPETSP